MKKKLKKIISLILAATLLLSASPVYATDANAAASTGGGGSTTVAGGASVSKQGVRMYMLDPNGQICSKVVDLVTKQPTGITTRGTSTRLGGGAVSQTISYPSAMPKPIIFTSEWQTNGYAIKNWLISGGTNMNGTKLIKYYLGEDALAKFKSPEEYFLVLEPLYWHKVNGYNTTEVYYGSAYEWISTGRTSPSSVTRNWDNLTAPNCMILDHERFGLLAPPKYGGNYITTFGNFGYGLHMYSNADLLGGAVQDTYNPAMAGSPHAAPPMTTTIEVPMGGNGFTVVKSYRSYDKSTNIKQDLGTYATDTSSSTIRVSNESGFKLVGWKASTSTNKNVPSLTWESAVPSAIKQTGSSAAEVDLASTKSKCLYVLFEKVEEKDETGDYNYLLHQSQITRRVGLYRDDHNMPIMADHTFWWQSPAFECLGGHMHMTHPKNPAYHPTKNPSVPQTLDVPANCGKCSGFVLTDNSITLSLQNAWANSYPNQLSTVLWKEQEYQWTTTRENVQLNNKRANGTSPAKFGLKVVFHRGDDALTIAQWKGTGTHLGGLSSFHVANTPAGTRRAADYIKKIGIYITDNSPDRLTIADATQHGDGCTEPITPRLCLGVQKFHNLQGAFSKNINIKYETYSGSNKKFEDVSPDYNIQTVSSNKHGTNDVYVEAPIGAHQTYYPYIQMRYDTLTGFDSPSGNGIGATNSLAYVLSEYQSSLYLNGAAEIIWQGSNSPNLNITSDQWSTHADFYDMLGNEALNSIIPGGAQLGMNTIGTTKKVRLVTYYPVFKGDGAAQINATSSLNGAYTEVAAEAAHNAFVDSVIQDIEGVSVDQFVDENYAASMNELYSPSNIVFRGSNISRLRSNGGSATKASTDNKYYFDHLGEIESMQEGDFDVISKTDKPVVEATVIYKSDGSFAAT